MNITHTSSGWRHPAENFTLHMSAFYYYLSKVAKCAIKQRQDETFSRTSVLQVRRIPDEQHVCVRRVRDTDEASLVLQRGSDADAGALGVSGAVGVAAAGSRPRHHLTNRHAGVLRPEKSYAEGFILLRSAILFILFLPCPRLSSADRFVKYSCVKSAEGNVGDAATNQDCFLQVSYGS